MTVLVASSEPGAACYALLSLSIFSNGRLMAYRVKIGAELSKDVRRLLTSQIGRAIAHLSGEAEDGGSAVHQTRKALKRCRSILRLARPGLSRKVFLGHDHGFRAIGRILSQERDREVMAETLTRLTAVERTPAQAEALRRAAGALDAAFNGSADDTRASNARLAIAMLHEAETSVLQLHVRPAEIETLAMGFAATYRDARKALKVAYRSRKDEDVHAFRKAVQHHWRHLQLLEPAWPELMAVRVAAARELSQLLGEDHDLSVLIEHIADGTLPGLDAPDAATVVALARAEQDRLRTEARPLAGRLLAQSPRDMERLIVQLWPSAKRLARHPRPGSGEAIEPTDEVVALLPAKARPAVMAPPVLKAAPTGGR